MNLVKLKGNDCFTNSKIIADGTGITHAKLKRTIRKHQETLKTLGRLSVPYGIESTGGRPIEVYDLNEQQATFLITLLKNTEPVIKFKLELVKEFYRMRQFILERQTTSWLETRKRKAVNIQQCYTLHIQNLLTRWQASMAEIMQALQRSTI